MRKSQQWKYKQKIVFPRQQKNPSGLSQLLVCIYRPVATTIKARNEFSNTYDGWKKNLKLNFKLIHHNINIIYGGLEFVFGFLRKYFCLLFFFVLLARISSAWLNPCLLAGFPKTKQTRAKRDFRGKAFVYTFEKAHVQ